LGPGLRPLRLRPLPPPPPSRGASPAAPKTGTNGAGERRKISHTKTGTTARQSRTQHGNTGGCEARRQGRCLTLSCCGAGGDSERCLGGPGEAALAGVRLRILMARLLRIVRARWGCSRAFSCRSAASLLSAFGLLIFLPGRSSLLSHAANFSYFRFCPRISVVIYLVPVSTVPLGTRYLVRSGRAVRAWRTARRCCCAEQALLAGDLARSRRRGHFWGAEGSLRTRVASLFCSAIVASSVVALAVWQLRDVHRVWQLQTRIDRYVMHRNDF
jgi:hypothetical protein